MTRTRNGNRGFGIAVASLVFATGCQRPMAWIPSTHRAITSAEGMPRSAEQGFAFDAGEVLAGQPLRHVFHYRNPQGSTLRVAADDKIVTSCGCTRATLARRKLAPRQTTTVAMEIKTGNRLGAISESATVTWVDDGGQQHRTQFVLTAHITSAFTFEPPELTFSKEELRCNRQKSVRVRSAVPVDWDCLSIQPDAAYLTIESLKVEPRQGELRFDVRCLPTHMGDSRIGTIRLVAACENDSANPSLEFPAALSVYSNDLAPLRVSPRTLALAPTGGKNAWQGYFVVAGDLIATGTQLRQVTGPQCRVSFKTTSLAEAVRRVDLTVLGPLDSLLSDQRELRLEFDNGTHQSAKYRLVHGPQTDPPSNSRNPN